MTAFSRYILTPTFLILLLFSCDKEEEKLAFITKFVENPEKIEAIMQTDTAFSYEPFVVRYFQNDSVKSEFIANLKRDIERYLVPSYQIYCNRERKDIDPMSGRPEVYHEITLARDKKSLKLKFQWVLEMGKWKLNDIFFTGSEYCR